MAWDIVNTAATTKYNVKVTGPAIVEQRQKPIEFIDGYGDEDIEGAYIAMGSDTRITVTWHRIEDLSDEPLKWSGRLQE